MTRSREIGKWRPRREDAPLVTGNASYTDDIAHADTVHAAFHRSQYGHARVENVDTSAAEDAEGVLGVYTMEDVTASGAPGVISVDPVWPDQETVDYHLLAGDTVRYAGEPIAMVVAEDRYLAHDAADLVDVDYERLDAVVEASEAMREDAPVVHDGIDDNCSFETVLGDESATEEAFADADHVVSLDLRNQRLIPDSMEPRGAVAQYVPEEDRYLAQYSTQSPHRTRNSIAGALGMDPEDIHVSVPDVGGGFGVKGGAAYSEEPLTLWAATQIDRPVKWIATRMESHQADHHGRDVLTEVELALDDDGTMRGLRMDATFNVGAYLAWAVTSATSFQNLISGQYDIPAISARLRAVFTNTTPTAPYRGAGRPEAIYAVERIVDHAARELDMDRVELRRRNQIPPDAFPYETAHGVVYDSGDYERTMDVALEEAGYEEWRERKRAAREEGRYLGIGVTCFVENTGTTEPRAETAKVRITPEGGVEGFAGTLDHGQGHHTAFSQVLADELGVDYEDVDFFDGDTDDLATGVGTFGSRSAPVGGSALVRAAEDVVEKARSVAAERFEADPEDVEFADGAFHLAGAPDRSLTLSEVATVAHERGEDLEATTSFALDNYAFSFGTHLALVEVDPDSGEIDILDYVAVDDCGVQLNPMIVEGQIHGGVAQGLGQALYEEGVYDDNGTLLTGSLQDYALPKAEHVPDMTVEKTETPAPGTDTGAKGAGESGTVAAPPVLVGAVVDALEPFGVDDLDMPLSAETVWRAIRDAE